MIEKIAVDLLLKGVVGGIGNSFVKSLMIMVETLAKPEYLIDLVLHIAKAVAKKTKTTDDDELVAKVRQIFIDANIIKKK